MCAAALTIWSIASSEKFTVMSSTTGRRRTMAAPTPAPTIVFSEIGVSRTRFSPNSSSSPCVTLKAPLKTPMSSPMMKTDSSRCISSRSPSLSASRYRIVFAPPPPPSSSEVFFSASCVATRSGLLGLLDVLGVLRVLGLLRRLLALAGVLRGVRRAASGLADVRALGLDDRLELLAARAVLGAVALLLAAVDAGRARVDRVPAADLATEHVDVVVERLGLGVVRVVGELDRLVDGVDRRLVELLEVVLGEDLLLDEALAERLDRVALAPLGDLLLRAVLLGVGHRVPAEAVRDRLDEDGLAVLARLPQRLRRDVVRVDDVHAVAAHPRHAEAVAALVQVRDGRVPFERRAHPELVVRDHEDDRQLPQRGEVERLAERALVRGAVAELAEHGVLGLLVVGAEPEADRDGEVAADDPVAAHEAALEVEHVHRAAVALRDAVDAAEELGHDVVRARAAHDRVAVRAVGRDEVVAVSHRARGADDRGLLADREMEEAADLGLRVHLPRALLEAADEHHRPEPLPRGVRLGQRVLAHVLGG